MRNLNISEFFINVNLLTMILHKLSKILSLEKMVNGKIGFLHIMLL